MQIQQKHWTWYTSQTHTISNRETHAVLLHTIPYYVSVSLCVHFSARPFNLSKKCSILRAENRNEMSLCRLTVSGSDHYNVTGIALTHHSPWLSFWKSGFSKNSFKADETSEMTWHQVFYLQVLYGFTQPLLSLMVISISLQLCSKYLAVKLKREWLTDTDV